MKRSGQVAEQALLRPPPLRPGARIAVIAPSGPVSDRARVERAVEKLATRYVLDIDEALFTRREYLAGSDSERLEGVRRALAAPDVAAILALRGGYGATRLLPELAVEHVRRANRWLIGFSDISALHALWARAGLQSIHAPNLHTLGNASAEELEAWLATAEGTWPSFSGLTALGPHVQSEGTIFGGNLSVLTALIGTPYLPSLAGGIVFLEDVGEAPYRIDRMLTQWHQSGLLNQVTALVLGTFTDNNGNDVLGPSDELKRRFASLGVPVVMGLPVGHVRTSHSLVLGARAHIDSHAGTLHYDSARYVSAAF